MQRSMHLMPRQGDREPWLNPQNYRKDRSLFRHADLEDGVLVYSTREIRQTGEDAPVLKAAS